MGESDGEQQVVYMAPLCGLWPGGKNYGTNIVGFSGTVSTSLSALASQKMQPPKDIQDRPYRERHYQSPLSLTSDDSSLALGLTWINRQTISVCVRNTVSPISNIKSNWQNFVPLYQKWRAKGDTPSFGTDIQLSRSCKKKRGRTVCYTERCQPGQITTFVFLITSSW